jgi:hypothetical protein
MWSSTAAPRRLPLTRSIIGASCPTAEEFPPPLDPPSSPS